MTLRWHVFNCMICGREFATKGNNAKYCKKLNCRKIKKFRDNLFKSKVYRGTNTEHYKNRKSIKNINKEEVIKTGISYMRYCLNCDKEFKAINKFIRICNQCKRMSENAIDPKIYGGLVR